MLAVHRNAPMSAQKVRLVVDLIRGQSVDSAVNILAQMPNNKKGAHLVKKVLLSAIANAENNDSADIDELVVSSAFVNEGTMLKRFTARARGRGSRIVKRTSHITIQLSNA